MAVVPALLLLAAAAPPVSDTLPPFADAATRVLIERAIERHRLQDSAVTDYTARIRYRLSASVGQRRWAHAPAAVIQEYAGAIAWSAPNDLRVDIEGSRARSRNPDWTRDASFDQPWFVPRGLGDSVRFFGRDFPENGAVHPLSAGGPGFYRYEPGDTVVLTTAEGARVRLTGVRVTPRRTAPALVAGWLWLDLASAEVVRFRFRYVGTQLWVVPDEPGDSGSARFANTWVNRIITIDADLEYALQEGTHWMPYRQSLAGRIQIPVISDVVIPFEAVTTFQDYRINTGARVAFTLPPPDSVTRRNRETRQARRDTLRMERRGELPDSLAGRVRGGTLPGGRYEIHRPPHDSLRRYAEWGDSLSLDQAPEDERRLRQAVEDLARLAEGLPGELTGIPRHGLAYEKLADVFRHNRVQGLSAGFGYQVKLPSPSFTTALGTLRYGFTDDRVTGRLALTRDAPGGRLGVSGFRELASMDPFSPGQSLEASFRSLFFARDESDHHLATGAAMSYTTALGRGLDLTLSARLERQRSVLGTATAGPADLFGGSGRFPPNPAVADGDYGVGGIRLEGYGGRNRWWVASDLQAGEGTAVARLAGHARADFGRRRGLTLRASAGVASSDALPQALFRVGGRATLRGYDYGVARGTALWAAQADWTRSEGTSRLVFFLDAGQAAPLGSLGHAPVLVGGGIGWSVLRGLVRFDLSHPITHREGRGLRFDIEFGGTR